MVRLLFLPVLLAIASAAPLSAFADAQSAGDDSAAVTEARVVRTNSASLSDQTFALLPQIGAFAFKDINDSTASRGTIGLAFDFNLAHLAPERPSRLYAGFSTGALYSHVGGPDAGFLGYNSTATPGTANSDVVIVPADVKLGYCISDGFRVAVHAGANAVYNSQPGSVQFGNLNHWNLFPDVGGDLDFRFVANVALGIRPDITFTPGSDFFTGSLEFGYFFG